MLRQIFTSLVLRYSNDELLAGSLWANIEKAYTDEKRYYHNLSHLDALLFQLVHCKEQIKNWDTLLFALFYHDIVYDVLHNDNEEKSAAVAADAMLSIGLSATQIGECQQLILATKSHSFSTHPDINLFTDADLSILGQSPSIYNEYTCNVRKEYSIYPDTEYNPGRRKVLLHFLQMKGIFKTDYFFDRYELQARENLAAEIDSLGENL